VGDLRRLILRFNTIVRADEDSDPTKSKLFRISASLLTPIASVFAALQVQSPRAFWAATIVAVVGLLLAVYSVLANKVRKQRNRSKDKRVLLARVREISSLIRRAESLVDTRRTYSDSLRYIIESSICANNLGEATKAGFVSPSMLDEFAANLLSNLPDHKTDFRSALRFLQDANAVINAFNRYCVQPVYEQELLTKVPANERDLRAIEAFRERWVNFIDAWSNLIEDLNAEFSEPLIMQRYFFRPQPLIIKTSSASMQ
jgi:hypothetical protein